MKPLTKNFFLAFLGLFVLGLADNIRGPLFPDMMREFELSNSQGSLFFATSSGLSFLTGWACHFFISRWGMIKSFQASLALLILAQFGIALSSNYGEVLIAVVFLGMSFGGLGVLVNTLVISSSPAAQLQRWQSGLHSMYGAASLLAPLLASLVYTQTHSWRATFYVPGFVAILVLLFSRQVSEMKSSIDDSLIDLPISSVHESAYFSFLLSAYVAVEILISSRLSLYLRAVEKSDFEQASLMTALFFVFLLSGRILFIFWHPRLRIRSQMLLSLAGTLLSIGLGLCGYPFFLALSGLMMAPFYPLSMIAASRLFPKIFAKVISYCVAISALLIVLMHTVSGVVADQWSVWHSFLIGPLFAGLAFLMILLYPAFFKRELP